MCTSTWGEPCGCCEDCIVRELEASMQEFVPRDASTPLQSDSTEPNSTASEWSYFSKETMNVDSSLESVDTIVISSDDSDGTFDYIGGDDDSDGIFDDELEFLDFTGIEYDSSLDSSAGLAAPPPGFDFAGAVRQHFANCDVWNQDPMISSSGLPFSPPSPFYGSALVSCVSSSDISFVSPAPPIYEPSPPPVRQSSRDYN